MSTTAETDPLALAERRAVSGPVEHTMVVREDAE